MKKAKYITKVINLKKGVNEIVAEGNVHIQNLCPHDISISFNPDGAGFMLAYKASRQYTLDGEKLYIKVVQEGHVVVEGIA
jgi:hypothetical protein